MERRERHEKMIAGTRARFAAGTNHKGDNVLASQYAKAAKVTADCKTYWFLVNDLGVK